MNAIQDRAFVPGVVSDPAEIQAMWAAIVEDSDDAIVSKDLSSIITTWNRGAERLFGYSADEVIGRSITLLIPADRQDEEDTILGRIRAGQRIDHFETIRVRKDGSRVEISLTVSPIRGRSGQIIGASKIARDISVRKLFERSLEAADRQKNEFLATLAHELRNPLAPIQNAMQILGVINPGTPEVEELRAIVNRQLGHLVRLVDDLLELSRITNGKIELRVEEIEVAQFVRIAVETAMPKIAAKNHSLFVTLPGEPIWLRGDPTRLSQAVANLLTNAAKYTPPGGQISVFVKRADKEVVIAVSDNGIGIPPEAQAEVLTMFSQLDLGKEFAEGGLGIGLSLVDRLVRLHSGSVSVHSEGIGKGSEFTIRLPLGHS